MIVEGVLKENDSVRIAVNDKNIDFEIIPQNALCASYAY
jgi:hypothetical protein